MKKKVMLSIRGLQNYAEQEPDTIELVTEGTMEFRDNGWDICYEESELTGLTGVTTTFRIEGDTITLTRSGGLASQMVFQQGVFHDSLYQTEFGFAMMITVCASKVSFDLTEEGGTVDLIYRIEIEQSAAGTIIYHLDVKAK
jgi:uncharacterized beta-barrel protein YwiB (DUF1934 family)